MFDPEAIEVAIFNLIKAGVAGLGFEQIERQGKIFGRTEIGTQPALFLIPLGGNTSNPQGAYGASKFELHYLVLVYARAETGMNNPVAPQTFLNAAWKAIFAAINSVPPGQQVTLGRLVDDLRIEGETTMDPGILDEQCALEIPILAVTGI